MELTPHQAKYFALELTRRTASDDMQKLVPSLMDAKVDLNPHQVEAALFAFKSPLSSGAILADEVGLGKTIEAGLVISQKWAERKRKILIIVPSNLRKQWYQELADKFFLPSVILEKRSYDLLKKEGSVHPFMQEEIIICSYQFARKHESDIKSINWDLVVIDEAHRLRNVHRSTNKIAKSIKDSVAGRKKILLTATPLQNSLLELYGLVSILDDYSFGDVKSFKSQYSRIDSNGRFDELKERLKPVCIRTLRRQVLEYIKYTNRIPVTQEFYPTPDEQALYDLVSEYLQSDTLYALPKSQRSLMTLVLRKLLASSTFAIAGTLDVLSQKLQEIIDRQKEDDTTLTRVVSDDFETYDELVDEWEESEDDDDEKDRSDYTKEDLEKIRVEKEKLNAFFELAASIKKNSKGEALLIALNKGFEELERIGAPRKAIIFTESTRTQKYLVELLNNSGFEGKLVLFNGNNNDDLSKNIFQKWLLQNRGTTDFTGSKTADIRSALISCFRDSAEIMIATEAAAEGVNLQFCSLVVNYDLPWNPQRIEQRIGRCHRYGQMFDVVVVNFLNKANAADQRVFELLSDKFKLFEGVFGASDEVLGALESGMDFEKRIARIYQECRTTSEIESAFDDLQKSLNIEIDSTLKDTRTKLLENFDEEVNQKLKLNLSRSKEYLSKYEEYLWRLTKFGLGKNAVLFDDSYSFNLLGNPFTKERIQTGFYGLSKTNEKVIGYRMGHPLAQLVCNHCLTTETPLSLTTFDYSNSGKKTAILEPLINASGWVSLFKVTVEAFETEDILLFSGATDDGLIIDNDICKKMFSLNANIAGTIESIDPDTDRIIRDNFESEKAPIIGNITQRNFKYFEDELEKLDRWGDDKRNSLKVTLKDFDDKIKELKRDARSAGNLPDKLRLEKERKKLEAKRDEAWREYDISAKEIERLKDDLIEKIESRLEQKITIEKVFTTRWKMV
ncbi:SNF2-related protein [Ignavibacteriales bacterium]